MNPTTSQPKKIKIAHVITRMIIGGAQENTLLTVLGLQEDSKYEVDLITGEEMGPEGRLDLSQVKNIIFEPSLLRNLNPISDLLAIIKLIKIFKRNKYDIVHTHSSKAGITGRIAAKIAGTKKIIHTIHGLPFHDYQNTIINFLYIILEKICAFFTDRIVVVAEEMKIKALNKGIGKPEQYIKVFSGMYLDLFLNSFKSRDTERIKLEIPKDAIVIGTIARLFPLKGHEYIFSIAQALITKYPNIIFLWVGDGILKDKYQELINSKKLNKNFIFTGLVLPEEISKYLSVMDILVHTSLREGLARVLPQSLASGIPVVSFDIDGAKEVIINNETGFLVPPKNTFDLQNRIEEYIKSPALREKIRNNGKKIVDPFFRHTYMVDSLKNIYQETE